MDFESRAGRTTLLVADRTPRRRSAAGEGAAAVRAEGNRRHDVSRVTAILLLVLGQIAFPLAADASGRVALVVGNSAYAHIGRLPNPANDASEMAAALGRLGFEVASAPDVDLAGLNEALRGFARRSAGAAIALIFYAGHGMEMDGVNYLLPVDARLERDTDVAYETVALERVLRATEGAELRVVILDACRNNPLAAAMQTRNPTRSISRGAFGALDERHLGDEMLVAYAAAEGTVAEDGTGRNSPFTTALLANLEQPLELGTLFRRVRAGVLAATDGRQRPHEYQSLLREHYLRPVAPAASTPRPGGTVDGATLAARMQQENLFWESIRTSTNAADFEAYLRRYPAGVYRDLSTNRLAALRSVADPDSTKAADPRPALPKAAGDTSSVSSSGSRPETMILVSRTEQRLSALLGRAMSAYGADENGWTDLHYAAVLNLPALVDRLLREDPTGAAAHATLVADGESLSNRVRRVLSEFGHDLDDWTRDGETPLHMAASVDAVDAASRLLSGGADLERSTSLAWTPLHYAALRDAHDVAGVLLAAGADVNARVVGDWTSLHLAVWADNYAMAALLLAAGADDALENEEGKTAVALSRSNRMRALLTQR